MPVSFQRGPLETSQRRKFGTPHFDANLKVASCGHLFHEACLLSWLEEGIRDFVSECARVERIPREMRKGVVAARYAMCFNVKSLVKDSGVGIQVLEELIGQVHQAEEDLRAAPPTTTPLSTAPKNDLIQDDQPAGNLSGPDQRSLGDR